MGQKLAHPSISGLKPLYPTGTFGALASNSDKATIKRGGIGSKNSRFDSRHGKNASSKKERITEMNRPDSLEKKLKSKSRASNN